MRSSTNCAGVMLLFIRLCSVEGRPPRRVMMSSISAPLNADLPCARRHLFALLRYSRVSASVKGGTQSSMRRSSSELIDMAANASLRITLPRHTADIFLSARNTVSTVSGSAFRSISTTTMGTKPSGASSSSTMSSSRSNCGIGLTVGCFSTSKPVASSSFSSTFSALMAEFNHRYTTPGLFCANLYVTKLLPVPFSPRITTYLPVVSCNGASCASTSLRSTQSSGGAFFCSSCVIAAKLNGLSIDATAARSAKSSELAYFSSALSL
mmetsp:Transcript_33125/g.72973  ORF Transcript_33125/g.72973 Transcript_33125/m.72973 type:complete len:267 (-) Transcript_33125:175-975(-)